MPTADQTAQIIQAAAQAPVNNMVVLVSIGLVVFLLGIVFLVYKFAPALINLYKQQADTNQKLTQIAGQNSEQAKLAMGSVDKNTAEMEKQTIILMDFKNFQKVNNDTTADLAIEVGIMKAAVGANIEGIAALKASIDALTVQIKGMLEDQIACAGAEELISNLKDDILALIRDDRAKHATAETPQVTIGGTITLDTLPPPEAALPLAS